MSLILLKLLLALGTLLAGVVGGLAPLAGRRRTGSGALVGAGNAFSAGLFLAIGMIHFLPESALAFAEAGTAYPLASLLAVASFLLLLLLEHVLVPEAAHDAAHAHSGAEFHSHGPGGHLGHRDGGHQHGGHRDAGHGASGSGPRHVEPVAAASPYVLVTALAVHSVLAGGALGAEADAGGAILTFVAIAVHKGAAGLALGLALVGAGLSQRRVVQLVALFALMTPIGILLGAGVAQFLREGGLALFDATAAALAGGTFLYIGTFDLVQDEFLGTGRRWAKWVWAVFGATLAALLALWL